METFSALLFFCAGNSSVAGEFPAQRPMNQRLNQQLSKQWRRRWFKTSSRSLWRHYNASKLGHDMETLSALLALCEGNLPHKGPVIRNIDVFIVVKPNNLLRIIELPVVWKPRCSYYVPVMNNWSFSELPRSLVELSSMPIFPWNPARCRCYGFCGLWRLAEDRSASGKWTMADRCVHHNDVIKLKHFPRYWPFVRGIHRWPVNSPHKGQWHGALMFSLICV